MKIIPFRDSTFVDVLTDEEFEKVRIGLSEGQMPYVERIGRLITAHSLPSTWIGTPPNCHDVDFYVSVKQSGLYALSKSDLTNAFTVQPFLDDKGVYYWDMTPMKAFYGKSEQDVRNLIESGALTPVDAKIRQNDLSFISHFPGERRTS